MRCIILGSGTCVPSLKRNAPGYYLEAEGCRVLVDCGSGTLLQLERAGRSYREIDAVFITHKHPDHFADLMPLIQAQMATPKFTRTKDLHVICPEAFLDYYEKAIASVLGRPAGFAVRTEAARKKMDFGPFHILTAHAVHSPDSISYRFEHGGKSLVFTGDADYDQGIIALAQGADLLVADCSFPDSLKVPGHLSAKECGMVAQQAGVKQLVLSHIYPADTPDEDRLKESREAFGGTVILAQDLLAIDVEKAPS